MQLEAFLGREIIPHMSSGQGSAIARAKWEATQFTNKDFAFDRSAGMADVHVAEYAKLAAADSAAGTYTKSMTKLMSFVKATRNALKERLSKPMTDKETETVVGIIGRMNLVLEITAQNFPGGIPASNAAEVDSYMKEINDLSKQLVEKRIADSKRVSQAAFNAAKAEHNFQLQVQEFQAKKTADTGTTVPGGGAPSSTSTPGPAPSSGVPGGGMYEGEEPPEIAQTDAQKYGPVLALAAGGIAAYFALR